MIACYNIFWSLQILAILLALEIAAQSIWPVYKTAFPCRNDGMPNILGICSCEKGWQGVDCSIPALNNTLIEYHTNYTALFSYLNKDYSNWVFVGTTSPFQAQTGALRLPACSAMRTVNPFTHLNYVITVTARVVSDVYGEGFTLFYTPKTNLLSGQSYGIKLSTFTGLFIRFSRNCAAAIILKRKVVGGALDCIGTIAKPFGVDDFAAMQKTFQIQIVLRNDAMESINVCTLAGCKSPFVGVDLSIPSTLNYFSAFNFDVTTHHLGVGTGNGTVLDILEYLTRENDFSFMYTKYLENWNVFRDSADVGAIVDPPNGLRLVPNVSNSIGSMWAKKPLPVSEIKIKPMIEIAANGGGNRGRGFGVFIVPNTSISLSDPFGINAASFKGLGVIIAPATNSICVKFATAPTTFDTTCMATGTYFGAVTDATFNTQQRLQVEVYITSTNSLSVKVARTQSSQKTVVNSVNLGVSLSTLGTLYIGVGAYSDSQRDSVDVFEVKTSAPGYDYTQLTIQCRNGGLKNGSNCICMSGWSGVDCGQPVCTNGCPAKNRCVAPNACVCNEGWGNPPLCDIPKCKYDCPLHSVCISPYTCQCITGWTGWDCSISTKTIRTNDYGPLPSIADASYGFTSTNDIPSFWNLFQPNSLDTSLGGVQPNGALRLVPSSALNRGAMWSLQAVNRNNIVVSGTVEIGSTGAPGDGFSVALVALGSTSINTAYSSGSEYMIKWSLGNQFQGAAVNFLPGSNKICVPMSATLRDLAYNGGGTYCSAVANSQFRRKFEFTIKILTNSTQALLSLEYCQTSNCYSPISIIFGAQIPVSTLYLGISAENNAVGYDSFDVYEVQTKELVNCLCGCTGASFACSGDGICTCQYGWSGTTCQKPLCPNAPTTHTLCTAPFVWACEAGWTGYECSIAICSSEVPKYGFCSAPDTITCISGWTGSDCSIPTSMVPYFSNPQTASFDGTTTSLTKFNIIPSSISQVTYYGSLVYLRLGNAQNLYNGGLISKTNIATSSDFAINATLEAKKAYIDGSYIGLYIVKAQTMNSPSGAGNQSAIMWPQFAGMALFLFPKTGQLCIVYSQLAWYTDFPLKCHITSAVTFNFAQKFRIGIVFRFTNLWVDICTINGCKSAFSNETFTGYSFRLTAATSGLSVVVPQNYMETIDVYEFLVSQIPYCNTPCSNGGTCIGNGACTCPYAWTGATCTTSVCSPNCASCPAGWTGALCTSPICTNCSVSNGNCVRAGICECNSGWARSDCTTPVCDPPCLNKGVCTSPGTCTCTSQWTDSICSTPICSSVCLNGGNCTAPNTCTCAKGWTGTTCQTVDCTNGCLHGSCSNPDTCTCDPNWLGSTCSTPICAGINECQNNGTCCAPNTCTCTLEWTGANCTTPICIDPVCLNGGTCVMPNVCNCTSNWTSTNCSIPTCNDNPCVHGDCTAPNVCTCWWANFTGLACATPVCSPNCVNGNCTSPDMCTCESGWSASLCDSAICNGGCLNGNCTAPDTCSCYTGWTGTHCENAICQTLCSSYGNCTAPNTCTCLPGWTNSNCSIPICSNGCDNGLCVNPDTCQCDTGWTGFNCSIAICSQGCANGGSCVAPEMCSCATGWTGFNCSTPICTSPCQNGGTCSAPENCSCDSGYTGAVCQNPICSIGCANGGSCAAPEICSCSAQWTGQSCDQPICSSPCQNGGTCATPNNCSCETGYNGASCEYPICSYPCVNGGTCASPENCTCPSGYNGTTCEFPICSSPCLNGGTCVFPETCSCPTGYTGSICEYPICNQGCANGGTCTAPDTCSCATGWTGFGCTTPICTSPCQNGGVCSTPNNCTCAIGHNGTSCEFPICSNPCINGGTCSTPNNCTCANGYIGTACEFPICSSPCLNGGTCSSPDNCSCSSGYNGAICQNPICSLGCNNGGSCDAPEVCSCSGGWTGASCENPICTIPCLNGGSCSTPDNCTCPIGYNGTVCENAICACENGGTCTSPGNCSCSVGYNGSVCQFPICSPNCDNGGTCISPANCSCAFGWGGITCSSAICSNPCINGGTCSSPNNCRCPNGYNGTACEIPICSSPCQNGGTCLTPNNCTCSTGYNGTACEFPTCNTPCMNGGSCSSPNNCTCSIDYNGTICQYPICSSQCQNGGNCTAPNICSCPSGYNGTSCEFPICSSPCLNGGSCSSPGSCTCPVTYNGTVCEIPICDAAYQCQNGGSCTAPNTCICATGWTGSNCTTPICSPSCLNGGTCSQPNTCNCTSNWTGNDCSIPICDVNQCTNGICSAPNTCTCFANYTSPMCTEPVCSPSCANGGNCTSPNLCSCPSGWKGTFCHIANCSSGCFNGNCTAPDICTCLSGWTGINCDTATCNPPCYSNGNCTSPNTCTCSFGWSGSNCTSPICLSGCGNGNCVSPNICQCNTGWTGLSCSTAICTQVCANGGSCTSPDTCTCLAGWSGANCTNAICYTPCLNGGTCLTPNNCTCPNDYNGTACQFPICANACLNGGTCSSPNSCSCPIGYNGTACEQPICNQGCANGGTCIAASSCLCNANWTGNSCSDPVCSSPCQNGGTCSSPDNCTCISGYNGTSCQFAVCANPCLNSGNCSSPNTCTCPNGFNGTECEIPICGPGCSHGGTCISPENCSCSVGWTGKICEHPTCSNPCLNGGTCTSPDSCSCPSGTNGTFCEFVLCALPCLNGGTCIGNDICLCPGGWNGSHCETLASAVTVLTGLSNMTDADFIKNIDSVKDAVQTVQQTGIPAKNLTAQEIKAVLSDVTSPSGISTLVDAIVSNPFFDPPVKIFSDEDLDTQAEVLSTLNQVTSRIVQLAASLTPAQLNSLTEVLAKAADKAATLAVQGALAVQSAVIKSDRLFYKPKLACTPLIAEKQRSSLKEASTLQKLDTLNMNFGDFIDDLITALLLTDLKLDKAKVINGDFYSVTVHKTQVSTLRKGLSVQSSLGGAYFPTVFTTNANFVRYQRSSNFLPKLSFSTEVLIALTTYVSNVMNSTAPYNFPTITVRMFTTSGDELVWASSTPLRITAKPPEWNRKQYFLERSQSQCDPHTIQCDLATNADVLGTFATVPMPSNAGDFVLSIRGDQSLPFDAYIGLNEKPTLTKYAWTITVVLTTVVAKGNSSYPPLRVKYEDSGLIRVVIPQEAISLVAGLPVTKVIDPTPPIILYVLVKRRLDAYSAVDDLPDVACQIINSEGFNFRINRLDSDGNYYRRKRQTTEASADDLELESNSSEEALVFKSQSLGTFTADLLVVPNTIEFAYILKNFEDLVETNWIVLATMATTLALFLVMIIPMRIFDNRDLKEWAFLPILSNAAHETLPYLISVHCNGCENYKSEPKVDIRIFGEVTSTHWRELKDGIRKNFSPLKPSNFILTTYHPVGTIERIEISVTSELKNGKPVELDIDRVIIVDVEARKKYIILCRSKLGALKQTKVFRLSKEDEIRCFDYLLPKHSKILSRDSHLWISIFRRPIPSTWTRCERLACIMAALFLAMLSNAMFYGKEPASPRLGVIVGGLFRVSWFTFWTSLVACFIVLPPICLIAFIFQYVTRRSAERSDWKTIFKIKRELSQRQDEDFIDEGQPKKKIKLVLPYWSIFVAWTLVGICIVVSAFLITLYSLQWGQEKSLQWLSALVIEILQDLIFVQTGKVFVLAVLNAGRLSLPEDGLDIGKLTFPEGDSFHRISLFTKLRIIATGLGHHLVYIVTFGLVIGATVNPYAYPQVKALKPHLFVDGYRPVLDTIPDHKVIFDHLLYRIIPNFLNGNQVKYGLNFPNADFYQVPNHDVVIIGPIRVRQIRAAPGLCPLQNGIVPQFTDRYRNKLANTTYCVKLNQGFDAFSDLLERGSFNSSWSLPVNSLGTSNVSEFQYAWLYRETEAQTYQGDLNDYGSGGYYVDLPSKLTSALRLVAQLRFTRWLDNNTTAVFFDFNLYNPQTNVFSVIKIVFESLSVGGYVYRVRRYPLKLYQYTGNSAVFTITLQSIWIFAVLTMIAKTIYKMKKEGFKKFRSNNWNIANLGNVLVSVIIISLFGARLYVSTLSLGRMHNYPDEFTDLGQLSFWEDLMLAMFGIGFFMAMMTSFQYLEANRYWAIFLGTLSKGKCDIMSYFAFFILMTTVFAGFLYLLVGPSMSAFCSYKAAFISLVQKLSGFPELTRYGFPDKFSMLCSMVYSGAILFCGGQLFLSIISTAYSEIARNVEGETGWDAELAKYLGDEWIRLTTAKNENGDEVNLDDENRKPAEDVIFNKFGDMLRRLSNYLQWFGPDLRQSTSRRRTSKQAESRRTGVFRGSVDVGKINQLLGEARLSGRAASSIRAVYLSDLTTSHKLDHGTENSNVIGDMADSTSEKPRSSYFERRARLLPGKQLHLQPVTQDELVETKSSDTT